MAETANTGMEMECEGIKDEMTDDDQTSEGETSENDESGSDKIVKVQITSVKMENNGSGPQNDKIAKIPKSEGVAWANGQAPEAKKVIIPKAPLMRFKTPGANAATLQTAPQKQVLTVSQLLEGLNKGKIRLTSPNATTTDMKNIPIQKLLQLVQQNPTKPVPRKVATSTETRPKRLVRMRVADDYIEGESDEEPPKKAKTKQKPKREFRKLDHREKTEIGIEYTELTEPPPGYMTVFMPVKQEEGNIKPILVPNSNISGPGRPRIPYIRVKAEIPTEKKTNGKLFCNVCGVYNAENQNQHIDCKVKKTSESGTKMNGFSNETHGSDEDEDDNDDDDCTRNDDDDDDEEEDSASVEVDQKTTRRKWSKEMDDFIVDESESDGEDEDDDYKPNRIVNKKPRKSTNRRKAPKPPKPRPICSVCEKPYTSLKEHAACSQTVCRKAPPKPVGRPPKSPKIEKPEPKPKAKSGDVPKCSVCNEPYISYDRHLKCSGAQRAKEKNTTDGQMRSVEIQRIKRRRRVHRFLKLNFTLHPDIPEPPERECVGPIVVRDEDDLLEAHFVSSDEKPPLGLSCYVCATTFPDDKKAYYHYTTTKCGPKYIGKVLFRARNRAENRPHNVMQEAQEKRDKPADGEFVYNRLRKNHFNSFKEKETVAEDGSAKKDHVCTACGESFDSKELVQDHYEREHRWRCKLCGDIYVHMKGIQLHYNRAHGRSFCILCHTLFDTAQELQTHMRTHQKRLCDLCGQVLANKHLYNKHMLKQHNVANAEPLHSEIIKTKPQPRGLCEICGKEYSWPFLKSKHMKTHLNPKPPRKERVRKLPESQDEEGVLDDEPSKKKRKGQWYPYKCEICQRGFQRSFYYNQHLERHAKGLACEKCGLFFAPQVDQEKHMSECRDHVCSECGEQCGTREALKRHKQTHPGTEVVCRICNREFASKFLLKNHAQIHKQYQCRVCSKRFPSMDHVTKHKCFGKKFQCKVCGERFSSIKMSKQHAKTEHNRGEGMDLFTKKLIEFEMPEDEESRPFEIRQAQQQQQQQQQQVQVSLLQQPHQQQPKQVVTSSAPMCAAGPSHVTHGMHQPVAQQSMTAHEVSQALMTLHDFPMGYSPIPINMARDREAMCKFTPAGIPPGYPGSYF